MNDRPRRLFDFLAALSQASRDHGVIVVGGDLEFRDGAQGAYKLNPNDGPEFAWDEAGQKARP